MVWCSAAHRANSNTELSQHTVRLFVQTMDDLVHYRHAGFLEDPRVGPPKQKPGPPASGLTFCVDCTPAYHAPTALEAFLGTSCVRKHMQRRRHLNAELCGFAPCAALADTALEVHGHI